MSILAEAASQDLGGESGDWTCTQVLLHHHDLCPLPAGDPWPSDAELYQPYEVEQVLLPDNAACLSVQAFLHMCRLDFSVVQRANAEQMSPSGRVPFVRAGKFVIAELDPIVSFVNSKVWKNIPKKCNYVCLLTLFPICP